MDVEALLFDIGGTVFDWQTAIVDAITSIDIDERYGIDAQDFAQAWRRQSLVKVEAMADQLSPCRPFDQVLQTTLDTTLLALGHATMSQNDRVALIAAWDKMPAWPETPDALSRLRQQYFIAPHTILSLRNAALSSKRAGINWDAIISCDALGAIKPNPESYRLALQAIGQPAGCVCFVASHPGDLRAARAAGMRTAYVVARLEDYGDCYDEDGYAEEFDLVADDFTDLANQLGSQ